jgi:hypothetical protein
VSVECVGVGVGVGVVFVSRYEGHLKGQSGVFIKAYSDADVC